MNWCHQSWEPALANFMATVHVIKAAKQSLSTLFASYSRISTFVYYRICISNAAEFIGVVILMQPYKLLPFVKIFCLGSHIFYFHHTPCAVRTSWLLEKWKWDCTITFLCLITCSFFMKSYQTCCSYLPINILQAIWFSGNNYYVSHFHSGFYTPCWMKP